MKSDQARITREHLEPSSIYLVHTSILDRRGPLLIIGSKVKGTKVKCAKTVSDQLLENALTYCFQT